MEEIISELIDDRGKLVRVAQALQEELSSGQISDEDIKYLTQNLLPVLEPVLSLDENQKSIVSSVLSPEILSTLKRLGFRYKDAIGDPLTELAAEAIRGLGKEKTQNKSRGKKGLPNRK